VYVVETLWLQYAGSSRIEEADRVRRGCEGKSSCKETPLLQSSILLIRGIMIVDLEVPISERSVSAERVGENLMSEPYVLHDYPLHILDKSVRRL
jgi:hypothetical protein